MADAHRHREMRRRCCRCCCCRRCRRCRRRCCRAVLWGGGQQMEGRRQHSISTSPRPTLRPAHPPTWAAGRSGDDGRAPSSGQRHHAEVGSRRGLAAWPQQSQRGGAWWVGGASSRDATNQEQAGRWRRRRRRRRWARGRRRGRRRRRGRGRRRRGGRRRAGRRGPWRRRRGRQRPQREQQAVDDGVPSVHHPHLCEHSGVVTRQGCLTASTHPQASECAHRLGGSSGKPAGMQGQVWLAGCAARACHGASTGVHCKALHRSSIDLLGTRGAAKQAEDAVPRDIIARTQLRRHWRWFHGTGPRHAPRAACLLAGIQGGGAHAQGAAGAVGQAAAAFSGGTQGAG